jgi:hypothetical protein
MNFDRKRVREVHQALEDALKPLAEQLRLEIRVGGARYTAQDIRFHVEVFSPGSGGPEAEQFRVYCRRYGLEPEDLGKEFTWGGRPFTLIGCKPRSTRFPLLGRSADGKTYNFAVNVAKLIRPGTIVPARGAMRDQPPETRLETNAPGEVSARG